MPQIGALFHVEQWFRGFRMFHVEHLSAVSYQTDTDSDEIPLESQGIANNRSPWTTAMQKPYMNSHFY
jgi:hypothetical protein